MTTVQRRHWRARAAGVITTLAMVFAGLFVAAGPAQAADVGDGYLSCNRGEICLKKNWDSKYNDAIKHFWYSQRHDNYNWGGNNASGSVVFAASMFWNRDTQCRVYVVDGYNGSWSYAANSSSGYGWVGLLYNDANYAHSRCSVHQNWGT
ncbi:hypothetical protein KBX50_17410 [Micromonospora sp. C51]|uniref:hypothetical protein n=1 Tax=Micromonospora sp. C51 TaxID=2824879 RepID=UPI001B3794DA|nr:hypothetical protein [Micromonospora sp. C51]MBQ1050241.1 hypothetical protein [Micromonospora sp. C51]